MKRSLAALVLGLSVLPAHAQQSPAQRAATDALVIRDLVLDQKLLNDELAARAVKIQQLERDNLSLRLQVGDPHCVADGWCS